MSKLEDAKLDALLWSLQGALEANEGGDAGQIEREFRAALFSALARAVDLLPRQRAALELVHEAIQHSQLGVGQIVVLRHVVARINAQESPVDVDWVRSTLITEGLIPPESPSNTGPFDLSMLERAYAMVMQAPEPFRHLLMPLLHRSLSDTRLFAMVEHLVTDRYFAHVLSGGAASDPFSLEELEGPIQPTEPAEPRPPRTPLSAFLLRRLRDGIQDLRDAVRMGTEQEVTDMLASLRAALRVALLSTSLPGRQKRALNYLHDALVFTPQRSIDSELVGSYAQLAHDVLEKPMTDDQLDVLRDGLMGIGFNVEREPVRHARLSGASARTLLTEPPPPMKSVPVEDGKRWFVAFQELISVHDGLLDEARDLRDLLGQAKEHIQRQIRRGEQGLPVDGPHLQAFLDRVQAEGE